MNFDVIGDVHGELPALKALGRELGYEVESEWDHPGGRKLIFLGDLVDRGGHSLEVAELVHRLHSLGRAICLMGNHEYNLVAHHLKVPGYEKPKTSNRPTIESMEHAPERWKVVLEFFRTLPIALEFPELRLIHACWHTASFEAVRERLAPSSREGLFGEFVVLASPFDERGLKPGLSAGKEDASDDPPQEILLKGYEEKAAAPFHDADGHLREHIRATWWQGPSSRVASDRAIVVGHYWNLPPASGPEAEFCPPHPSGHPKLKAWQAERSLAIPERGCEPWKTQVACIDFNGVTAGSETHACVGAVRWPERQIVWAMGKNTRKARGRRG